MRSKLVVVTPEKILGWLLYCGGRGLMTDAHDAYFKELKNRLLISHCHHCGWLYLRRRTICGGVLRVHGVYDLAAPVDDT